MRHTDLKQMIISILIGACVAFITTAIEGFLDILKGTENNIVGGVVTTLHYLTRKT